jgi:hypothetical protein
MATEPTETAKNLNDVILQYSKDARWTYDHTHDKAQRPPSTAADKDAAAKEDHETAEAQKQNGAAFSQLVSAASLESEQRGRAGYAAVVQLMQTTSETADRVCQKLIGLLHAGLNDNARPADADIPLIAAFTDVLRALAELSPDAIWETRATSS